MADYSCDVAIIGGAVMGSSAAFWLSRRLGQGARILVIEPDPGYSRSSTALSVASIRQQFSNPVNIRISRSGIEFIRNIATHCGPDAGLNDLGFRENGYLFVTGHQDQAGIMKDLAALQRDEGAATELLSQPELQARFPYLSTDDLCMGSFGPRDEGWFDNMGLLAAFRNAAKAAGVQYMRASVKDLARSGGRVDSITLDTGERVSAGVVINAAGTAAADLMGLLGEKMPVEPRKRTVFCIDAPAAKFADVPLLVDYTGFYLRPEGQHWLCATVPDTDAAVDREDFDPDHGLFEDVIWEKLYNRCSAFEAVKVLRCWAGHYAFNTLDQNAIVGRWPGLDNLFVMNGFSGHGLQQAPAMGRGISELVCSGGYETLDLSELGPDRILTGQPFLETAIV